MEIAYGPLNPQQIVRRHVAAHVDVHREQRAAMRNRRKTSNNHEFDIVFSQSRQEPFQIGRHLARSRPRRSASAVFSAAS
jgi:hypothetical protein